MRLIFTLSSIFPRLNYYFYSIFLFFIFYLLSFDIDLLSFGLYLYFLSFIFCLVSFIFYLLSVFCGRNSCRIQALCVGNVVETGVFW